MIYRIDNPEPGSQEYFLLENRNSNSSSKFDHMDSDFSAYFDWFTPGQNLKDPGLLILHVDDAVPYNDAGPNSPHYMVIVEDAGYDPAIPWDGVDEYSDWWYPYEFRIGTPFAAEDPGQTSFTPLTTPNTDWYDGASDIWVTNISQSGSLMTFDVGFGNAWPAVVDHNPTSLTPTVLAGYATTFSVVVADEDGDPTTYDWYEEGVLEQSGPDPAYDHQAGPAGSVETLMAVATDGELADSVTWVVTADSVLSADGGLPVPGAPGLAVSPTPFGTAATIRCTVPTAGHMRVAVHDLSGRVVSVLYDAYHGGGTARLVWNGTGHSGEPVASGVYFVRMATGAATLSDRLVLLR
jgi:hypothetical protein